MDGPNTNWLVFERLHTHRDESEQLLLEMIGSCGLHVVSVVFQKGVVASGWELEKILKAMWRLFQDSPARKDVYIKLNTCTVFALCFRPTCWVENEEVAGRTIMVWDNVVKVVQHYQSLCQSKRPQRHSTYKMLIERSHGSTDES